MMSAGWQDDTSSQDATVSGLYWSLVDDRGILSMVNKNASITTSQVFYKKKKLWRRRLYHSVDHLGIWCQIHRNMKTVYGSKEGSAQSAFCNSILWMTESVFRKEKLWRFWIAHGLKHITSSLKQWSQCDACACLASIGTGWRVYSCLFMIWQKWKYERYFLLGFRGEEGFQGHKSHVSS